MKASKCTRWSDITRLTSALRWGGGWGEGGGLFEPWTESTPRVFISSAPLALSPSISPHHHSLLVLPSLSLSPSLMAELLLSTGKKHHNLPESYIRPEPERPRLNEVQTDRNIPVIDLNCPDKSRIIAQVTDACQTYGIFQVHTIPSYLPYPSSTHNPILSPLFFFSFS